MVPKQPTTRRAAWVALLTICVLALSGCAESDTPLGDAGDVVPGDGHSGGNDTTGGSCNESDCQPGDSRCAGPSAVVRCKAGPDGCGSFQTPTTCPEGQSCRDGECRSESDECVDGDGDGYGMNCAKGPDCDDQDPGRNPGAKELCDDNVNNDCDSMTDEDCQDPCANQPCNPGQMRCNGEQVEVCEHDSQGCGTWSGAMNCPTGKCEGGSCADCQDRDGDGYGQNCPSGPDCDDSDDEIHDGAQELCDDKNNDCDGETDEGYPTLGDSCDVGRGICKNTGTVVCASNGTSTTCTAMAGTPEAELCGDGDDNDCDGDTDEGFGVVGQSCTRGSGDCQTSGTFECDPNDATSTFCDAPDPSGGTEVCDGKDNDCDQMTDEGGVCTSCTEDQYEPNDSSTAGTQLLSSKTLEDFNSCGPCTSGYNVDWIDLGTQPTSASITVELSHPTGTNSNGDQYADLDAEFFCGSKFCDGIRGTSGTTSKTLTDTCGCSNNVPWTLRIYPRCNLNPNGNPPSGTPYDVTRR